MKWIKRNLGAMTFILGILGIDAILWIQKINAAFLNGGVLQTSLFGASLLMGFMIVFLLSTRMRWLVKIFGGLENVYFWHRVMAILTTALILLHGQIAIYNLFSFNTSIPFVGTPFAAGEISRNLFFLLIGIALLAKFIKYENFRLIHRLLIIPYFIGLYHSFYSSWINLFQFNALSIWMISTSVIGLAASLYMIFFYQRVAFINKGTIVDKINLNDSVIELKIKMDKDYKFKPGQFTFVKIKAKGISKAPHPFSVSGKDGENVYLTIKSLGDFTDSLRTRLDINSPIKMTKPFGNMTFKSKEKRQIWIAGGIGITPFLSYLRITEEYEKPIHLFYSVNYDHEAVHIDTLNNLAEKHKNFTFTLFEASKKGYLHSGLLDLDDDVKVYMCGPRPMALSLEKQIRKAKKGISIEYEAFSFTGTLVEDLLKYYKKMMRKLRLFGRDS